VVYGQTLCLKNSNKPIKHISVQYAPVLVKARAVFFNVLVTMDNGGQDHTKWKKCQQNVTDLNHIAIKIGQIHTTTR